MSLYTEGRQPCSAYTPRIEANAYGAWANVHSCYGPYDGRPQGDCAGTVSFCERCNTDHHSRGWDACPVPRDPEAVG